MSAHLAPFPHVNLSQVAVVPVVAASPPTEGADLLEPSAPSTPGLCFPRPPKGVESES